MGFERDNILLIKRGRALGSQIEAFKQELIKNPEIVSAEVSNSKISGGYYPGLFFQTSAGSSETLTTRGMSIDNDFFTTIGLHCHHTYKRNRNPESDGFYDSEYYFYSVCEFCQTGIDSMGPGNSCFLAFNEKVATEFRV
jgi:hypothetical protein